MEQFVASAKQSGFTIEQVAEYIGTLNPPFEYSLQELGAYFITGHDYDPEELEQLEFFMQAFCDTYS